MSLLNKIKVNGSLILVSSLALAVSCHTKSPHITIRDSENAVDSSIVARTFVGENLTLLGYDYDADGNFDKIDIEEMVLERVGDPRRKYQRTILSNDKDFAYYNKILSDSGNSYQSKKN